MPVWWNHKLISLWIKPNLSNIYWTIRETLIILHEFRELPPTVACQYIAPHVQKDNPKHSAEFFPSDNNFLTYAHNLRAFPSYNYIKFLKFFYFSFYGFWSKGYWKLYQTCRKGFRVRLFAKCFCVFSTYMCISKPLYISNQLR